VRTMINFRTAVTREHPSRTFGLLRVRMISAAPTRETATANKGLIDSISMVVTRFLSKDRRVPAGPVKAPSRRSSLVERCRLLLYRNLDFLVLMRFRFSVVGEGVLVGDRLPPLFLAQFVFPCRHFGLGHPLRNTPEPIAVRKLVHLLGDPEVARTPLFGAILRGVDRMAGGAPLLDVLFFPFVIKLQLGRFKDFLPFGDNFRIGPPPFRHMLFRIRFRNRLHRLVIPLFFLGA